MKLETVKDLAMIATQIVIAIVVVWGQRWNQGAADTAAREQKKLELAVDILKTPKPGPLTAEEKGVRDWAKKEFERQQQIAWTPELDEYFKRPPVPSGGTVLTYPKPDASQPDAWVPEQLEPEDDP